MEAMKEYCRGLKRKPSQCLTTCGACTVRIWRWPSPLLVVEPALPFYWCRGQQGRHAA